MVEILSARPPTPPRTTSRMIDENQTASVVQTPKASPFASLGSEPGTSSRSSKRVNFSPWPKYIKPPTFASTADSPGDIKTIPSTDLKPAKSILKATQIPVPDWSPNIDTFTAESLAMLLESVIQQLAGESITSRLDAYMQFFSALRTYDGLPTGQEIAPKLNLITDFIQRDVNRDLTDAEPHARNLTTQALKLSAAFVWHPQISTKLSEDFKNFLIDNAITSLHDAKAPKSVLTHHMSILSTQNFGPKVMTTARVTRLLVVLQEITDKIPGNAIVSHRLSVYQRLLGQAKPILLSQASLWIEHLVFGLLHHIKDTRVKAISFGFQLAADAGPNPNLSKSIRDIFERPLEHDRKLVAEVQGRVIRMMSDPESGVQVPQIWSIVILLLRNKRWSLEQWHHYKEWLLVVQKCFNCSDPAIKARAVISWNRFVSVVGPEESTSRSQLKMLAVPVLQQFERKKIDKSGSPPSQVALHSYNNLLYYAFRPSASNQHLDFIWEEYVVSPCLSLFSQVPTLSDCLSRIVSNLLWSPQAKLWTEARINDPTKMNAEELPSADSKWVRSRISSVLKVFEHLFKSSVWVDEAVETSNIALAWNSLSNALSLASSKEITPTGESMQAVAGVLGLLHRLWIAGPRSLNASSPDIFFKRFQYLSTTMILSIGGIPFTEKLLLRTADETFVTATTPTHRHPQRGTNLDSPILHLLRSMSSTAGLMTPSESYKNLIMGTIEAACSSKLSRGSRLELLQRCAELSTAETSAIVRAPVLSELVWNATAKVASNALQSFPIESARERDGSVSRDYDNVLKILSSGLTFPPAFDGWSNLLESFVRVVRAEKGDPAIATMIVEPMAERIMHLPARDTYLPSASLLGHVSSVPFLQGTGLGIDAGGLQSLGQAIFPHKFLQSVSRSLESAYDELLTYECHGIAQFIEALSSFLGSGVPQFQCQVLQGLQSALSTWVKDEANKLDIDGGAESRIHSACNALSFAILVVLQASVPHDLGSLNTYEQILLAGFESSHILVAKKFVDLWPSTFGSLNSPARRSTLWKAFQSAESLVERTVDPTQNGDQDAEMVSPPLPQDAMEGSQHSAQSKRGSPPKISPVLGTENAMVPTEHLSVLEPQLPSNSPSDTAAAQSENGIPTSRKRRNRREMFSMLESIQSSSPANTPRKSGLNTPPHLRRIQSGEAVSDLLLTPTLAPAEHEDGFIGSSPTPGTRDPTPAMKSAAPVLMPQEIPSSQATDPPSSPPEMHSRSPSPQKAQGNSARSRRRKAAKARKALVGKSGVQSTVNSPATSRLANENNAGAAVSDSHDHDNDKENADSTPRANATTPSRRLRSAAGKGSPTATDLANGDSPDRTPVPKPHIGKSNPGSSAKRKQNGPKTAPKPPQQAVEVESDSHYESFMDSSEEVETQIASQLGQDLELAVDMDDKTHEERAQVVDEPSLRKRKRDDGEKTRSFAKNDRRRSTRLSTVKDDVNAETLQVDTPQSPSSTVSSLTRNQSPIVSVSPTATRRSARNSQKKENNEAMPDSVPAARNSPAPEPSRDDETPRPSKRSRKSARIEDQSATVAFGNDSHSASQDARPRKTRSQPTIESQFHSQFQRQLNNSQPEESLVVVNPMPAQDSDLEMVPESLITEEQAAEQNIPPVSTEEATDSQVSEMEHPTNLDSVEPAIKMDLDPEIEMVSQHQLGDVTVDQPTSLATASTQTREQTPPQAQSDASAEGITQTLKSLLGDMQLATLGPEALREVDDLLFNIRVAAHDASHRHNTSA